MVESKTNTNPKPINKMSQSIFSEIAVLDEKFKDIQHVGGHLSLQFIALERDANEINQRLLQAFAGGGQVVPILEECRDNLIQRAEASKAYYENLQQVEALCRQSADAISRLILIQTNPA